MDLELLLELQAVCEQIGCSFSLCWEPGEGFKGTLHQGCLETRVYSPNTSPAEVLSKLLSLAKNRHSLLTSSETHGSRTEPA